MFSKIIKYIVQIVLIALPFLLPQFQLHDSSTLLTSVSLLFAILIGFFMATTTSNYLRLQTLIANSNAGLISLYKLVKGIEPDKKLLIEQAVDEYMIATLDFELLDHVDKTRKEFNEVIKIVDAIEPKDQKGFELFSELHSRMNEMFTNDQEIALTAKKIVTPRHWLIIILLGTLLGASLLSFRNDSFFASLFVGIMFIAIYHIMVLIHEIDSNLFLSNQLAFEDPQQVFLGIGRPNYYPEYALKKGDARPTSEVYRIGIYKNYPHSFEKEIKLIELKQ